MHGRGAMAYLPAGVYVVSQTLPITGSDYVIGGGGSGMCTRLVWQGDEDGAIFHAQGPRNVTLQHIAILGGEMDDVAVDILHTHAGGGSRMTYDGVWAWGAHRGQPFRRGFHFRDLNENDEVLIRYAQGNMRFTDCARARILVNVKEYAPVVIEGRGERRDGFLGFMSYLATSEPYCLYVHDNQSVVLSDFYHEQSAGMFYLEGAEDLPPGRVTWTGGRTHVLQPGDELRSDRGLITRWEPEVGMRLNGFRGRLFIGGQDFSDRSGRRVLKQDGSDPVAVFFFGNTFYNTSLDVEGDEGLTLEMLANEAVGANMGYVPHDNVTEDQKAALSGAFDDLRRLGQVDRELNYIRPPTGLFGGQAP